MKKLKYLPIYIFLALTTMALSCKKFVQEPPPKNQLISSVVYADSLGANAAINGIYIQMMGYYGFTFANGGITAYTGLSGDELYESASNPTDEEFYNNAIAIDNSQNQTFWTTAYQHIYAANACINGIQASQTISPTAKQSLIAEALVIRSFLYFNLVNIYGAVPLITGISYTENARIGRTPVDLIYQQIINDLKLAQSGLSRNTGNNTRVNFYVATALLSKVYLYTKQYPEAITEADKVINSENFLLASDLNSVFLSTSNETIWSFAPVVPGFGTTEGYFFLPSDTQTVPAFVLSNTLYNSFEPGDLRKTDWASADTIEEQVYPFPDKYKTGTANGTSPENYVILRLADQYLIEAEAKANSGDLPGSLLALNTIRHRAGLPGINSNDKSVILAAIVAERQHEFFCEWGNRFFDLNRLNFANTLLGSEKKGWRTTANLYPIPQNEINLNPALKQNPGY